MMTSRPRRAMLLGWLFALSLLLSACDFDAALEALRGPDPELAVPDGAAVTDEPPVDAPGPADDAPPPSGEAPASTGGTGDDDDQSGAPGPADDLAPAPGTSDDTSAPAAAAGSDDEDPAADDPADAAAGSDDPGHSDDGAAPKAEAPDADAPDRPVSGGDAASDADDERPADPEDGDGTTAGASADSDAEAPGDGDGDGADDASLTAVERDIVDLLNAARADAGLAPLAVDADVARGARRWSCTMAGSGAFRHADIRAAGVNGENIAFGQRDAAEVHRGWMNSAGHRSNRMNAAWSTYGVGVCTGDNGALYFTERFVQ